MFQVPICTNREFCTFLPEETSRMRINLFYSQGWSYRPSGRRISQEGSFERKIKVIVPFLRDQEIGGQQDPSCTHFFPKSPDQNFEIVIFFSIFEISNNYIFHDDLQSRSRGNPVPVPVPPQSRGKGCKLWALSIVYIQYWLFVSIKSFSGFFSGTGGGRSGGWRDCSTCQYIALYVIWK